jgi:hypothetical protein
MKKEPEGRMKAMVTPAKYYTSQRQVDEDGRDFGFGARIGNTQTVS